MAKHGLRVTIRGLLLLLTLLSALVLTSCGPSPEEFQALKHADNIEQYNAFLSRYPDSKYTEWIDSRIRQLAEEKRQLAERQAEERRQEAERRKQAIEEAIQKGDLKTLLSLEAPMSTVSEVILAKGTVLPEEQSKTLTTLLLPQSSNNRFGSISSMSGASQISRVGDKTAVAKEFWYRQSWQFAFAPEAVVDGELYRNICHYSGQWYQMPSE